MEFAGQSNDRFGSDSCDHRRRPCRRRLLCACLLRCSEPAAPVEGHIPRLGEGRRLRAAAAAGDALALRAEIRLGVDVNQPDGAGASAVLTGGLAPVRRRGDLEPAGGTALHWCAQRRPTSRPQPELSHQSESSSTGWQPALQVRAQHEPCVQLVRRLLAWPWVLPWLRFLAGQAAMVRSTVWCEATGASTGAALCLPHFSSEN